SALRFYERQGLIAAHRTSGNQRRYPSVALRRVALIQAGKAAGIPLERIGVALDSLPDGKQPTKRDWERLSAAWRRELDERIATLEAVRDRLTTCIGCGCLSLKTCRLLNPVDEAWHRELSEFIAIPSVSADVAHRDDVKRAGEWVCDFIRTKCHGSAQLTPFGEKELALGEIPASHDADNAPTVVCYGHFDVQPPAPLDLWESDPFTLAIRDDWAYGRGVTDDKGQVWILLKAAQKLVEDKALPVNLRFVCDGEEEIGGTTVVDYLGIDDRGADAAIIFDGGMLRQDVPVFSTTTRGLIAFDVKVSTGDRDLHSGMYGGAAMNAIHVLMRCLQAVLAGPDGRLPEPLRQGIAPPEAVEVESWKSLPSGADELRDQRATPLDAKAIDEFYLRTTSEPSADVNGILGGKPGLRNTTLSVHASGEFTVRLAPGQRVDTIGAA